MRVFFTFNFDESNTPEIQIITADDEKLVNLESNNAAKYEKKCVGDTCEFIFNPGTRCVEVIHKEKTIWKYDENIHEGRFPTRVVINISALSCWVFYEKEYCLYKYRNRWKMIFKYPGKLTVLDIKSREYSPAYSTYHDENLGMRTYVANQNVLFRAVMQSTKCVWFAENSFGYADKVVVRGIGSSTKTVTVYVLDGPEKEFNKLGGLMNFRGQWSESAKNVESKSSLECVTSKLISLDINLRSSTNQFRYIRHQETNSDVYVTKNGCYFKLIRQSNNIDKWRDYKVWSTEDPDQYGVKLVVTYVGPRASEAILWSVDGSKKCFYRPLKYFFWLEKDCVRAPALLLPHKYPSDITIVTVSDYDDFKHEENNISKYSVYRYGHILQYIFKDAAKCVQVRSRRDVIWNHNYEKHPTQFIKELYVNTKTKEIKFNRYRSHFIYNYYYEWLSNTNDDKKRLCDSEFSIYTLGVDSLIKTNDNSHFDEEVVGPLLKIRFKPGIKCVDVKYENRSIWRHDDSEDGYPISLHIHTVMKVIFVDMNPELTHFYRFSDNDWKLEPLFKNENFRKSDIRILTRENGMVKENDTSKYDDVSFGVVTGYRFKNTIDVVKMYRRDKLVFRNVSTELINFHSLVVYFLSDCDKILVWDHDKSFYIYS